MVARTRIWRRMVAIMRGGNFCGAAWQRPQLARKRCSPWNRMLSACVLCTINVPASSFLLDGAPAKRDDASARLQRAAATKLFVLRVFNPLLISLVMSLL